MWMEAVVAQLTYRLKLRLVSSALSLGGKGQGVKINSILHPVLS
jgi:hypothetical protein